MFFIGAYFAKAARDAHPFARKSIVTLSQHYWVVDKVMYIQNMVLSNVLVGYCIQGHKDYLSPPTRLCISDPNEPRVIPCDSCVDVQENPNAYVIFNNRQIYPEYVIQYESSE